MKEKTYNKVTASVIDKFLREDNWNYSFDEDRGLFEFSLNLNGKIKKIRYIVDVKDDEYLVYAICPIGADLDDPQMMARMAEFICRANYGLKLGNFEFDFRDGEIRYKCPVIIEDITPTTALVKRSIYCPATLFDRYGSGIVDIIFNETSPESAVEKCEKDDDDAIRRILSALLGEESEGDSPDEEVDEMIDRLAQRFGVSPDDAGTEDTSGESGGTDVITELFEKMGGAN